MSQETAHQRLLYLVKQFYRDATQLAAVGDDLSATKAVLFLDLSVEQMFYALIADFGSQTSDEQDEPTWKQLWQRALKAVKDQALMTKFPNYPELRTLHSLRNLAQHQGVSPNPAELGRFIRAASNMLSDCFRETYGLSFDSFELWDGIRNADLRRLVKESQAALEMGDVLMALVGTVIAFRKSVRVLKESQLSEREKHLWPHRRRQEFPLTHLGTDAKLARVVAQAEHLITQVQDSTAATLERLHEQILLSRLGLPLHEIGKYRELMQHVGVQELLSGEWSIMAGFDFTNEEDHDNARFALRHITQLVIVAQDVAPSVIDEIRILIPLTEQPLWKERRTPK